MSRHGRPNQSEAQSAHLGRTRRPIQPEQGQGGVINAAPDMTSCEQIRQLLVRCRRSIRAGAGPMRIDLRNVTQADTKLVACLVAVYQLARDSSVRIELAASQPVIDAIDVCRLGWLIERTASK